MIAAGHKVAICEQTEDAGQAKGLIRREVVRLMTPGTLTDDPLLDGRSDNYLAAVAFNVTKADGFRAALCWVELSTGDCVATSASPGQIVDEIARAAAGGSAGAGACVQGSRTRSPSRSRRRGLIDHRPRPGWQVYGAPRARADRARPVADKDGGGVRFCR